MKKILLSICLIISLNGISQCDLTGVNDDLTLQFRHWKLLATKIGIGTDSLSINRMRAFRTQMIAANPATDNTNVTINNVPGEILVRIYEIYLFDINFAQYFNMGSTDAERRTIFTNIRALTNPCIVARVAILDAQALNVYANQLTNGKNIIF